MTESMYIKPKAQHLWENRFPNYEFNLEHIYGVQFLIVPIKARHISFFITFIQRSRKQCYTGWVKKNLMFVSVMLLIILFPTQVQKIVLFRKK